VEEVGEVSPEDLASVPAEEGNRSLLEQEDKVAEAVEGSQDSDFVTKYP